MEGGPSDEQRGIYSRALADLFSTIEARSREYEYSVKVSMVEIYKCEDSLQTMILTFV